ncbi:NAD-dependent epimerase/dehydratase family protein [Phycicoccus sp. M110.8]|uniref:NAD-dependent epimerase/dehydratase family protein n=1 Tax=Phycicoccus sp. M110.8 TaxID=3075433 RepID=UPI0028FD9F13|nr:NAD-dependent epimerase/dehydratase family protein [Phycicoccus sp. M110.8]MDU0315286.1 NAD-dependent epimerase/dehydratase family protein [Phycicoccus sp. M110.8]
MIHHREHTTTGAAGRVLVIGAGGYLGGVVTEHLLAAGHQVRALTRPGEASSPVPDGVTTVPGDLRDPDSLRAAVTADVDAVVHLATPLGDEAADLAALDALVSALAGTGRALLYTSGAWVLGPSTTPSPKDTAVPDPTTPDAATRPATVEPFDETSPTNPIPLVGYRHRLEERVLAASTHQVRGVVVRPGVAHGRGGGIPALLVELARQHGVGRHVGERTVRWPMVHVDDLADLFVLALQHAPAGSVLHGVTEEGVDTRALAAAAAEAAGVSGTRGWSVDQAADVLGGPFAQALACDQVVSSERTRRELGWQPHRPSAVDDVAHGSYRVTSAA